MTIPTTKTRYLRDPKNKDRVLTLVTKVEDNKLSFAVAVNSPPRVRHVPVSDGLLLLPEVGDRFERRAGARIALGRLECDRTRKSMTFDPKTQHPLIVVLAKLALNQDSIARIARDELKKLANHIQLKKLAGTLAEAQLAADASPIFTSHDVSLADRTERI